MINLLFWLVIALYGVGWVVEFARYWQGRAPLPLWGGGMLALGWGSHTIYLGMRLLEGTLTLSHMLNAVAWVSMVIYHVVHRRYRYSVFGFVFPPFSIALLLTTMLADRGAVPVVGGLQEQLAYPQVLTVHIVAVLAGHLLFAMACLVSIVYLYVEHDLKAKRVNVFQRRLPPLGVLERLNHKAIALGFFFLSVGILLGMLAASMKEISHLISARQIIPALTWVVYAVFLLEYAIQGRRGRFGAVWSIAGFVIIVTSILFEMHFLLSKA